MSGTSATNKALWGGDYVYCCDRHLVGLVNIGNALGVAVEYEKYQGSEVCKNCEREQGKEATSHDNHIDSGS